jgi:phospholipase/carboxylesterase
MENVLSLFEHIIIDNRAPRTLFLLHGTGGSAQDFLFLNEMVQKSYNLVGLLGNVSEDGMARFFKRLAAGVFDQESIREESSKLHRFVHGWVEHYGVSVDSLSFLGYSNGANILIASLFYYPSLFRRLVLLHPMLPFDGAGMSLDLSLCRCFVSMGRRDRMISFADSEKVVSTLEAFGADVVSHIYDGGHEISELEIQDIVRYIA